MAFTLPARREDGSLLPLFGALLFTSFVMVTLVVELTLLGFAYRSAASAADAAAEAGAAMLAEDRAYADDVALDVLRARDESIAVGTALARSGAVVEVDATPLQVCVTVRDRQLPATLSVLGVSGVDITVNTCAEPRVG